MTDQGVGLVGVMDRAKGLEPVLAGWLGSVGAMVLARGPVGAKALDGVMAMVLAGQMALGVVMVLETADDTLWIRVFSGGRKDFWVGGRMGSGMGNCQ